MADFPEVEKAGRLMPHEGFDGAGSNEIRLAGGTQENYETRFTYADQALLDILKIPMIDGDRDHALTEANTMVISRRKADEYGGCHSEHPGEESPDPPAAHQQGPSQ